LFTVRAPGLIYTLSLHDALPIYGDTHEALLPDALAARPPGAMRPGTVPAHPARRHVRACAGGAAAGCPARRPDRARPGSRPAGLDRKSTRLNSSHVKISYAVFCL